MRKCLSLCRLVA